MMRTDDASDTESVQSDRASSYSGPLVATTTTKRKSSRKSARFNLPPDTSGHLRTRGVAPRDDDDDAYVEITLDIHDDSIAVHSVQAAAGAKAEDPELALLARKTLEKKSSSSSAASLFRNTSSTLKHVSQELKRFASLSRRPSSRHFDRTKSAVTHALKGLKFITAKAGGAAAGWPAVEKRFDELTASTDRVLHFSLFSECIGNHSTRSE